MLARRVKAARARLARFTQCLDQRLKVSGQVRWLTCDAVSGWRRPHQIWRPESQSHHQAERRRRNSAELRDAALCAAEGAPGGTRTPNPQLRRLMLYPLSYERKINRPESVPAELPRGAPLMAVGAPDETLVDLGLDSTPRNSAPDQNRDFSRLQRRIGMVELQDDRILLPAVDTRMSPQVLEQSPPNVGPLGQVSRVRFADVVGRVLEVVFALVLSIAGLAVRLPGPFGAVLRVEFA